MKTTAQAVFRELENGKWYPFYLVVGDEPFQTGEILARLKAHFVKGEDSAFSYESFDAEGVDAAALLASLETLPGLFDGPDSLRLVVCRRFDKATVATLETLEPYFKNPSASTCFVISAAKADKRKAWYKAVEEKGAVLEVAEPYEREWSKWQGYFEKKLDKRIAPQAWAMLLDGAGRSLSLLWGDLQRAAAYVGEKRSIDEEDARAFLAPAGAADVFAFAEDVVALRAWPAMEKFHALTRHGESEIKLLSILLRQFRQLGTMVALGQAGVHDSKTIAAQVGVPPFVVAKLQPYARRHATTLGRTMHLLADCDYRLKVGEGSLLEHFLVPYFSKP